MKVISSDDLATILIALNRDRAAYTINDFERILEKFGDDMFIVDGEWKITNRNPIMKAINESNNAD